MSHKEMQPWVAKSNVVELLHKFFCLLDGEQVLVQASFSVQQGADVRDYFLWYAYCEATQV